MSIASRTLHTIHPTPPTATATTYDDDDIPFDSGGKGDPEPYLFNTFGPLDEVEETSHGNGAQNDNNTCKGDIIQDPSLKTKATADYCETNFNANSISTIVETNEQQQQTTNPPPDHEDQQEQQPKEMTASTAANDISSSYDAKESAQHLWEEDGVVVPKEHAAEWLGGR